MNADEMMQVLVAKDSIRQVLQNYCRSIDRLDRALMESIWHPDATVDYEGLFKGSAADVVDFFMTCHLGYAATSHQITNVTINVDGDTASSEAYVTAVSRTFPDASGRCIDLTYRGRYLDRWSKRGETWAIDHRYLVTDVHSEYEVAHDFGVALPDRATDPEPNTGRARRSHEDLSYQVLREKVT